MTNIVLYVLWIYNLRIPIDYYILTSAFLSFTVEISGRFFNSEIIFILIAFLEIICKRSHEKILRLDSCLRKIVPCRDTVAVEMS
jgi:hypothetical protein